MMVQLTHLWKLLKPEHLWVWTKRLMLVLLALSLWAFAGKRQKSKTVNKVHIHIENEAENHFLNADQIEAHVGVGKNNMIYMRWYDSISLYKLERKIESLDYVKDAEVSHDVANNLFISVVLIKPIARIILGGSELDRYLGEEGQVLPTSERYAAKVPTVDGPGSKLLFSNSPKADSLKSGILDVIKRIHQDPFWNAQIAHIYLDARGDMTFYPQVGTQIIEFGSAAGAEQKFQKLFAFYTRIIPVKGWSAYSKVNLKFKNQIVCQKTS